MSLVSAGERGASATAAGPAVSTKARGLLALPPLLERAPVLRELAWFWPVYLWHHRRPWTRRLHFIGSCACIAGAALSIALAALWPLPAGILVGYLFAFTGHWAVERNRPLSFGQPVLAGMCNWIMFSLEVAGRLERHLQVSREESQPEWDEHDVGSE